MLPGATPADPADGVSTPWSLGTTLPRVRLHPLLRTFAAERFKACAAGDQHRMLNATLRATRTFVAAHRQDFAALAREEEALAGAVRRAAQEAQTVPGDVIASVDALRPYLTTGGRWRLGLELTGLQLTAARAQVDRREEAHALHELGWLSSNLGDRRAAREYLDQALAIFREVGDRAGEGTTLNNLGSVASDLGDKRAARRYYEQALIIRRAVGDRAGEGVTLNNLGLLASDLGDQGAAREYYEQALAIFQAIGMVDRVQVVKGNLAALHITDDDAAVVTPSAGTKRRHRVWPFGR